MKNKHEEWIEEKASRLCDFSTRWNMVDCRDFIRTLRDEVLLKERKRIDAVLKKYETSFASMDREKSANTKEK